MRHPTRFLVGIAVCLAAVGHAAGQQRSTFDPTGTWEGRCVSGEKSQGTLHVEFRREGRAWRAKGGLQSPGYPPDSSEFEEVAVDGDRVSFIALWGPMVAQFKGERKASRLDGTLEGVRNEKVVFRCDWSLTRLAK